MTSIALDAEHAQHQNLPSPNGSDRDRLWLMIAITAPLSAVFWGGLGWASYRALMHLCG